MSRSRRFEQRILIERAALQIVNSSYLAKHERLAGLTAAAIESWLIRIKYKINETQRVQLNEILVAIATETGLLSDNSRAVFSSSAAYNNETIDGLLVKLATCCGNDIYNALCI